jgi:hypothetical protein
MSAHLSARRSAIRCAAILGLTVVACTESSTVSGTDPRQLAARAAEVAAARDPNSAAGDTKAFIGAWLDGEAVQLRYTRSYFCENPPSSVAPSGCEIGALPEDFPRSGPIPVIYAIAPIGFTSLETVRTLQATLPGQISRDNPTNIFFFFHPAGESAAP